MFVILTTRVMAHINQCTSLASLSSLDFEICLNSPLPVAKKSTLACHNVTLIIPPPMSISFLRRIA